MKNDRYFLLLTGLVLALAAGFAKAATVPETAADNDMNPCFTNSGWANTVGSYDCVPSTGFNGHIYLTPPDGNNYGGGVQYLGVPGVQETIEKTYTNLVVGETYAVEWYIMTDLPQGTGSSAEAWFDVALCSDQQETRRLTPDQRRIWFQERLFFTADATSCNLRFTARNTQGDNSSWVFLDSVSIGVAASSDLGISKLAPPTMPEIGGSGVYILSVTNDGPDATTDSVEVIDMLPAGVTVNGGGAAAVVLGGPDAGDWSCTSDAAVPQTISCNSAAALANGASNTFDFTADFAPGTLGDSVTNTATVQPAFGSGTQDPNETNDLASAATVYVDTEADMAIAKTGPAAAIAGTQVTYDIVVTNNGPADAETVSVADPTPAGYTFASATAPCAGGFPCAIGTVTSGSNVAFSVTYDIDPAASGDVINTATVSTTTEDPIGTNDSASVTTTVGGEADMAITKTGPASATAGTQVTYDIAVTNNGPSDAQTVSVADPTPAGYTFASATAPCAGGFPCAIGAVTSGANVAFSVTYDIDPATSGDVTNTATVSTATDDPTDANDSASATTTVGAVADLSIVKTANASTVEFGGEIVYTIEVSNAGPSAATNVVVTDNLPAGQELVSTSGCAEDPDGAPDCSLGTIASGASATYTLTAAIVQASGVPQSNTASVASDTADPDDANNTSTAGFSIAFSIPTLGPLGLLSFMLMVMLIAGIQVRRMS